MRFALAGVLIARIALAGEADAGFAPRPTVTHLRSGDYLVPAESWQAIDAEMRRLRWQVDHPPKEPIITPPIQAYLIGMAIVGTVFTGVGFAAGYCSQTKCF